MDPETIVAFVTNRLTDLNRMYDLEKQLQESKRQNLEMQDKLRQKEVNDLATKAGKDVLEMLSLFKR